MFKDTDKELARLEAALLEAEEEGVFDLRTKRFVLKPMTVEEAILQMNLLGHNFYVFENADSAEICIVYKRNAGSYGIIIPDKNV